MSTTVSKKSSKKKMSAEKASMKPKWQSEYEVRVQELTEELCQVERDTNVYRRLVGKNPVNLERMHFFFDLLSVKIVNLFTGRNEDPDTARDHVLYKSAKKTYDALVKVYQSTRNSDTSKTE